MGFCIMFPHLCGLKTLEVAEMAQTVLHISDSLEIELNKTSDITERLGIIATAKEKAVKVLKAKGKNYYEMG